jgi:toxin ParE1/3/4
VRVRWTVPALHELEVIGEHIARDNSPVVATRVVTAILDQVDTLTEFPNIGRPGRLPDTRELVVVNTPFIVPYRVRDAEIEILSVFHGARKWPETFG